MSEASPGLTLRISHKARSIWPRAAPAVTTFPDLTTMPDSSSNTSGYRSRNIGASHQVVVARRWLSRPDSARTKVPVHAALNVAPSFAHFRTAWAASRTSGLARPAFRVTGVLHASAGTITHPGFCLPTGSIGTFSPCAVWTVRRIPTILTSNCGTASPVILVNSFAVWKASKMADKPRSKASSSASTKTRMTYLIPNMAFLPMVNLPARA